MLNVNTIFDASLSYQQRIFCLLLSVVSAPSLCNFVVRMSHIVGCNYFNWLKLSTLCWTQMSLALFLDSKQLLGVLAVDVSLLHHYFMALHLEIWWPILLISK